MGHPKLSFWSKLIQLAAAVMLLLSAILLLTPAIGEALFNLVYFYQLERPAEIVEPAVGYVQFANGVLGAVMAGWMVGIIMVARGPLIDGQPYAWNLIAIPLATWFVVDTAFSINHGAWGNVALNVSTAIMFSIPLLAARRCLRADDV